MRALPPFLLLLAVKPVPDAYQTNHGDYYLRYKAYGFFYIRYHVSNFYKNKTFRNIPEGLLLISSIIR